MKVSHAWLQSFFEDTLPSAEELAELLTFHAFEIEGVEQVGEDSVIDVDVLPNRSSDCLSHRGIARELSTLLSRPMRHDPLRETLPVLRATDTLRVEVDVPEFCPRYLLAYVRGVKVGPSPDWLRTRLETLGQRSINNVVDLTNYVMLNTGQPLHAFDAMKIDEVDGVQTIRVRRAHEREPFTSLSGESYTLSSHHHVIADDVADTPLALAGVKGGVGAEVDAHTTDLLVEVAHFHYAAVRAASRELKLATDASLRFQNSPSVLLPDHALRDMLALLDAHAEGVIAGVVRFDAGDNAHNPTIDVPLRRINRTLGTELSVEDVERILIRLEFPFSRDGEEFAVSGPWERSDINIPADVIEEIGRVHGYRDLKGVLPPKPATEPEVNKRIHYFDVVRDLLRERGYSEVYTYTLEGSGEVELENPLAQDKSFLRRDLRTGIQDALVRTVYNAPLLGLEVVRIFSLDVVFVGDKEVYHLALGIERAGGAKIRPEDLLREDISALEARLGISLAAQVQDNIVEVGIDTCVQSLPEPSGWHQDLGWNPRALCAPLSSYPFVLRDVAVWVPSTTPREEIEAVLVERASDLLVRHDLFDTFERDGKTSYAWHLVFQSPERTLTDDEVTKEMSAIIAGIESRGWVVR